VYRASCDRELYQYQQIAKKELKKFNAQCRSDRILCEANKEIQTNVPNNMAGKIKVDYSKLRYKHF